MARKIVHLPPIAPETWDVGVTGSIGVAKSQEVFQEMRNAERAAWGPLGLHVSDIGVWTSGTFTGMIYESHDPVQEQSKYTIGGYSTSGVAPDIDEYLGATGANLRTIVKELTLAFASASNFPGAGLTIGVNPDTSVSRADLDFDDATALTYSGGDFTALSTVNPDSLVGLQAIFPSHCTYAMSTNTSSLYRGAHCTGYDTTEGVWLYMRQNTTGEDTALCVWGACLDPSADANEYGTIYMYGSDDNFTGLGGFQHTIAEVSAFDPTGTLRDYDLSPSEGLDIGNYKVSGGAEDGDLNWRKVSVDNGSGGSGIKGHVKESVLVEIGIFQDGSFNRRPIDFPDTANPVVRYSESCAVWWEDGARLFPSYYSYNR